MDEVDILRALVEEYSPSGHEAAAVDRFVSIARSLGFHSETDPVGNGIARIGAGPPTVLFLGHIDTVEGALTVRLDGDRLWGRGTCDAKGALVAALAAATGHTGRGEIVLVAAVGEERDSRGARHLVRGHRPDFLIVGEPSGWDAVTIGYKGNLSLVLRIEGTRSHLSAPEPTTVEKGIDVIERIRRWCADRRGPNAFESVTMKVVSMETTRHDGAERLEVGLNFRLPPGFSPDDVVSFVREGLTSGHVEWTDRSAAVEVNPKNDVVRALCRGIRDQGARPTLLRKLGTSDLNLAVPAWGCPAAAYGPGDSHLDHTDREHLDLQDLRHAVSVLRTAFSELASGWDERHTNSAASICQV